MQASLSSHLGAEASSNFSVVHGGHHSVSSGMAHGNDLALAQHTSRALHLRDGAALLNTPTQKSALSHCCKAQQPEQTAKCL